MNLVTTIYIDNNCRLVLSAKLGTFIYRTVIANDTVDAITLMAFNKNAVDALRNKIISRETESVLEKKGPKQ